MLFDDLLARAAEPTLLGIVGRPCARLIARLNSEMTSPETLRELAQELMAPQEMLAEREIRSQLLLLLRSSEAADLAGHLGWHGEGDPFDLLVDAKYKKSDFARLLSFFGLSELPQVEPEKRESRLTVTPMRPLFAHQARASREVAKALSGEPPRVLLHMPTGSGKTRTAMRLICDLLNAHEEYLVVWLAHSEELCEQAAEEFESAWFAAGNRTTTVQRWWGSNSFGEPIRDGLIVAGLAKAHAAVKRWSNDIRSVAGKVSLVVMDEAHQAIAPSYKEVLDVLAFAGKPTPVLGLSATPGRTWSDIDEDEKLSDFFGRKKVELRIPGYESPVDYLVDEGYLARVTFTELTGGEGPELSEADRAELASALEIPERILRQLAEDEQRNLLIVHKALKMTTVHRRMIIFAATVDHARLITAVLRSQGVDAAVVTGETDPVRRAAAIEHFKEDAPEPRVLVNFGVLTTGFDAPRTSAAMIARPTKSLVLYSQMVGRATRGTRAGGNPDAEVVTVVDSGLPGFRSLVEAFHNWEDVWE